MEYQEIIKLLDNTSSKPSEFRTKNWVEINDDSREMNNTNSHITFDVKLLKLLKSSDVIIVMQIYVTVPEGEGADANNICKKAVFKNCAPFTDC